MTRNAGKICFHNPKCHVKLMTKNVGILTEVTPIHKDQVSYKVKSKLKNKKKKRKNFNFMRFMDLESFESLCIKWFLLRFTFFKRYYILIFSKNLIYSKKIIHFIQQENISIDLFFTKYVGFSIFTTTGIDLRSIKLI